MNRRRFLTLTAAAGATGFLGRSLRESRAEPDTRDPLTSPTEETDTAEPATATTAAPERPAPELEVISTASGLLDVSVRLTRLEDLTTIYNRERELSYAERIYLSGQFDTDTDYLVDIAIDGDLVYEDEVAAGERVVLGIRDATTVVVVDRRRLVE
ncbi:twin-arginine translocation signal domain-containing protein [Haloarchaeobius sp. TZWSO28]|uniref:twin-arginine translocation signal domain-containing protein n=1 Tax=Haloarchaeobius sp. TZWSO28 TaxID=3446119 RepID=UPI003EBFEC0C